MLLGSLLFADGALDPHTLSGGALVGMVILLVKNYFESRERQHKATLESAERLAKIEADKQLATKAATLEAKVGVLETSSKECRDDHKVTSEKLALCEGRHETTESRIASLEQSVNSVAIATTPPKPVPC
jgi:outer membrane murein-binding lipoprotein Lpp